MNAVSKSILTFILRTLIVISPIILILLGWYIWADPFKVIRHYDCYYPEPAEYPARIGINKGIVTFTNFEDRIKEGHKYDSFIFGSSISCYYDAATWSALIKDSLRRTCFAKGNENHISVNPYHFDSSGESLISLAKKVKYLDDNGIIIRHALIILDPVIMAANPSDSPGSIDPPQLHKNIFETIGYHYTFFRAATNADFFKSYIPGMVWNKPVKNGHNMVFERQPIKYDPLTNQETLQLWDSIIRTNPEKFYSRNPLNDSPIVYTERSPVLSEKKKEALERIAGIFSRHATDYHIIIGPNRAKITLNKSDLAEMQLIFESGRVHDFSTSHAPVLEADTMLYDNTHYRPPMAEIMMRQVYGSNAAE
ncbi:MAG: hypothetical protein K2M94_01715 [Paramuribaculum sp.]|nr:hypothetical protein [Paramuribaculum sp.]